MDNTHYAGVYERQFDDKNRIIFPAQFVKILKEKKLYQLDRGEKEAIYLLPENYYHDLLKTHNTSKSPLDKDFNLESLLNSFLPLQQIKKDLKSKRLNIKPNGRNLLNTTSCFVGVGDYILLFLDDLNKYHQKLKEVK